MCKNFKTINNGKIYKMKKNKRLMGALIVTNIATVSLTALFFSWNPKATIGTDVIVNKPGESITTSIASLSERAQELQRIETLAFENNQTTEAITAINNYLGKHADDISAMILKGKILESDNKYEQAIELYKKINTQEENLESMLRMGEIYLGSKKFLDADKLADHILDLFPENSAAFYLKARVLYSVGDRNIFLSYLDNAILFSPENVEFRRTKAYNLANMGRIEDAIKVVKDAIVIEPDNEELYLMAITYLQSNKKPLEARPLLEKLTSINPGRLEYRNLLAISFESTNEFNMAEKVYRDGVSLYPNHVDPYLYLSDHYIRRVQYTKSNLMLSIAATKTDDKKIKSEILARKAYGLFRVIKFEKAKTIMNESLELNPQNKKARTVQAKFLVQDGEFERAKQIAKELLSEDPDIAEVYYVLAVCVENIDKDEEQAQALIQQALAISPNDPEYILYSAQRELKAGELNAAKEKAGKIFAMGKEQNRDYVYLTYRAGILLGDVMYESNELDRAQKIYTKLLSISPQDQSLQEKLAKIIDKIGDEEDKG